MKALIAMSGGVDSSATAYLMRAAGWDCLGVTMKLYQNEEIGLTQTQLAAVRFPVGALTKVETRALAEEQGLVTAHKPDSQDICFVPNGRYVEVIQRFAGAPAPPGNFVDLQGRVVGRHKGLVRYTIGQHKGLGLVGEEPLYVCAMDAAANTVTVGPSQALFSRDLIARDLNFIAVEGLLEPRRVKAKIRYRQTEQWATAVQTGPDELRVRFDEPQRAITPGQAVVLYDGDLVVGGGTIET